MAFTVGLVLAGGFGVRLGGVRKGDLRIGNVSLTRRLVAVLESQCDIVLVSLAAQKTPPVGDIIALMDDPDGITGPAAGLMAGAVWCKTHRPDSLMLSVSVDTPFFPSDFAERAKQALQAGAGCVVSAYEGRDYPTNALWRPVQLAETLSAYSPSPRGPSVRQIQKHLGATFLDYGTSDDKDPFAGINTLDDLLAAARRENQLVEILK